MVPNVRRFDPYVNEFGGARNLGLAGCAWIGKFASHVQDEIHITRITHGAGEAADEERMICREVARQPESFAFFAAGYRDTQQFRKLHSLWNGLSAPHVGPREETSPLGFDQPAAQFFDGARVG